MTDVCAIGGLDNDDEPRHPAADPILCLDCHLRIVTNLDWIRRNYGTLTDHLEPGSTGNIDGIRTAMGSKLNLRVGVLSMAAKGGISGILGSWVQLLIEDRQADPPNYRLRQSALVAAQAQLIKAHTSWLVQQPFAPEFYDEIQRVRGQMAYILGGSRRRELPIPGDNKTCILETNEGDICGGDLMQNIDTGRVKCWSCEAEWGPAAFLLLGRMLRQDESA